MVVCFQTEDDAVYCVDDEEYEMNLSVASLQGGGVQPLPICEDCL